MRKLLFVILVLATVVSVNFSQYCGCCCDGDCCGGCSNTECSQK